MLNFWQATSKQRRCPAVDAAQQMRVCAQASAGRAVPFFGSHPPPEFNKSPAPARGPSPSQGGLSSSMQAQAQGLRWLATWVAATHAGLGQTEAEVLPGECGG